MPTKKALVKHQSQPNVQSPRQGDLFPLIISQRRGLGRRISRPVSLLFRSIREGHRECGATNHPAGSSLLGEFDLDINTRCEIELH